MPWAAHKDRDGKRRPVSESPPRGRGVTITDMPGPKPEYQRARIKGVPGATTSTDEDHQPGGGTWYEATP